MSNSGTGLVDDARLEFERLLVEMRPKLHRFCARMTGSAIDGEDIVQDAILKALESQPKLAVIVNLEGWLFRIAFNTALDFLRRRARDQARHTDDGLDMIIDPTTVPDNRETLAASLRTFMRLPVTQRGAVILKDVLGYSLQEVSEIVDVSALATKSTLQRGRTRLRELVHEPDDVPPPLLTEAERTRLLNYVERFNENDFDAVREMLAEDVRLELVNRTRAAGRHKVSGYFDNYSRVVDWVFVPGFVDRRPAILVRDRGDQNARPTYFILLDWKDDRVIGIRDFRFARYAIESAELIAIRLSTVPPPEVISRSSEGSASS